MFMRLFIALFALSLSSMFSLSSLSLLSAVPASAAPAEWTLLYYMAADNDLARAAVADVNELESFPGHPDVQTIVLLDISAETYSVNGPDETADWDGARILKIRPDTDMDRITSPVLKDLGPANTGDPNLLRFFVEFAVNRYPAKRVALFIWNHGTGWKTIPYGRADASISPELTKNTKNKSPKFKNLPDLSGQVSRSIGYDDVARDSLTLGELSDALGASAGKLGRPFDLLVFDACLMQMAEIIDAVGPAARFVLASEEVTPDSGYRHGDVLARFARNSRADGAGMGRELAASFLEGYRPPNRPLPAQISLIDQSNLAPFKAALAKFAATAARPSHVPALRAALSATKRFQIGDYVDLAQFVAASASFVEGGDLSRAAANLRAALDSLVIENLFNSDRFAGCGGLSIYLPEGKIDPDYLTLPFARSSGWLSLLRLMLESNEGVRVEAISARLDDPDADGRLAAGEESRLIFTVKNRGRAALKSGDFTLRSGHSAVKLLSGRVDGLAIASGDKANLIFRVVSTAGEDLREDASFTLHLAMDGETILVGRHVARLSAPFERTGTLLVVVDRNDESVRHMESACAAAGIRYDLWIADREGPLTGRLLEGWRGAVVLRLFPGAGSALTLSPDEDALLSSHVRHGGRLLVSGQDLVHRFAESELCRNLSVRATSDSTEARHVLASDGTLAFNLNGPHSADNQDYPDVLALAAGHEAVFHYDGETAECAGLLAKAKSGSGRALFLGFGLEGIAGDTVRGAVLRACFAILSVDPGIAIAEVAKNRDALIPRESIDAHLTEDLIQGRYERAQAFLNTAAVADPSTRETLSPQVRTVLDYARTRLMEGEPDPATADTLTRLARDAADFLEASVE